MKSLLIAVSGIAISVAIATPIAAQEAVENKDVLVMRRVVSVRQAPARWRAG